MNQLHAALGDGPTRADGPLLDVRDLSTTFFSQHGPLTAVDEVNFTLAYGEVMGLVGESGSGKSVTALSLARLVPHPGRITGGRILYQGTDLLSLSMREMRDVLGSGIGFVFQDPMTSLNPVLTIGEQMTESVRTHLSLSPTAAIERAVDLLDQVGIPQPRKRLNDYPHQFSGGMRQRVMIAIAMSCDPALLLADEPTTALDATVQAQILDLIRKVAEQHGTAVLFITHDLGAAAYLCDRISVMYAGRIVETGATDAVLAKPQMPYTRGLLESIPALEGERRLRLPAIEGSPPDLSRLPAGCRFHPRCPHVRVVCRGDEPTLTERLPGRWARCWATEEGGWLDG